MVELDPVQKEEVLKATYSGGLDRSTSRAVRGLASYGSLNPEQKLAFSASQARTAYLTGRWTYDQVFEELGRAQERYESEVASRQARRISTATIQARADIAQVRNEFAQKAQTNIAAQEQAQTRQLEKVAKDITSAGLDPSKLQQAQGKPNPNAALKINTAAEIRQRQAAQQQVSRSVASVMPDRGVNLSDSTGKIIATNVKQSGNFTMLETKPKQSQAVKITGVSEGAVFSDLRQRQPPVQGPVKQIQYPGFVKSAFYSFPDEIGPKKPETFTGLVGKDFFAKDEFVGKIDALGVPRPGNYGLKDITLENFGRGFYEGGVLPITQAILAPKPIFSDIFGRTESENKGLKKTVEKIKKVVPAGPVASGEIIGQLITGKPIIGTGRGLGYDVGSVSFDIATAVLPSKKGIPLKVEAVEIPVGEISKTLGYRFTLGYGKLSKPVITTIGKSARLGRGESIYKNLEKAGLKDISPTGRGFEFLTLNKTNASILASDTALDILQRAGKITPLGRQFIVLEKEAVGLIKDIKLKPTQKSPLLTSEGLVSDSLESGEETRVFVEKILPRLFGFKGSQAQRIQVRQQFIAGTGRETLSDFDIDYGDTIFGTLRAKQATKRAENLLSGVAGKNRRFVSTGTKLFSITLDNEGFVYVGNKAIKFDKLTRKEQQRIAQQQDNKIFELLTKKDASRPSGSPSSQDLSQVGGLKLPKDQLKIKSPLGETIKVKGLRFQMLTKIASSATLQGPLGEKFKGLVVPFLKTEVKTKEDLESSFRIGPFIPRYKDVVDQPFLFKELGTQGIESGKYTIKGQRLVDIGEQIKTLFPEIDFGKPSGSIIIQGEKDLISNIGSSVASFSKSSLPIVKGGLIQTEKPRPKESMANLSSKETKSISGNIKIKLDNLIDSSIRSSTSSIKPTTSILNSLSNIRQSVGFTSKPQTSRASPFKISPSVSFGGISGSSIPNISSPAFIGSPSGSPGPSPGRSPIYSPPYSPTYKPPPGKSLGRYTSLGTIRIPDVVFPRLQTIKPVGLLFKFDQVKNQRLPSYAKRRFFVASPSDPLRAGVFAPKGVKELRSSSSKIFKQIDVNLAKARRKKKAFDPLTGFKIAKSGKYVYVSKYPLKI